MAENGSPASSTVVVSSKRRAEDGGEVITLAQPRPGTARRTNEYIETPLRPNRKSSPAKDELPLPRPVTSQPKKQAEKQSDSESSEGDHHTYLGSGARVEESIICRQCGRCRCDACRTPRILPSRWVCHEKILCSAPAAVEYCSCLCCVKGLFYHWGQNYGEPEDEGVSCADQPCSCAPNQRCLRWGCLGVLSLALPCLCCYWPLRGCLRLTEKAYAQVSSHGCRCGGNSSGPKAPQTISRTEKRLLDSSNSDC